MEQIINYLIDRDIKYRDNQEVIRFEIQEVIRFEIDDITFKVTEGYGNMFSIEAQNTIDERTYAIMSGIPSEKRCLKDIKYLEEELKCDTDWL